MAFRLVPIAFCVGFTALYMTFSCFAYHNLCSFGPATFPTLAFLHDLISFLRI